MASSAPVLGAFGTIALAICPAFSLVRAARDVKFIPRTRHPALCFEHFDSKGALRHVVVLRATFEIAKDGALSEKNPAPAVNFAERAFGEMLVTPPYDESHLAPEKPSVDLIVHASAHAPEARPAPRFGVELAVSEPRQADGRDGTNLLHQQLTVTGPRDWYRSGGEWALTDPLPVTEVPLRFDLAYGGTVRLDDPARALPRNVVLAHRDNPVGRGFAPHADAVARAYGLSARSARTLVEEWEERTPRLPAPQIEHPSHPVEDIADRPPLAGWGLIAKHWAGRYRHAGTYDASWMRTRYPVLPVDFDPRYWNAAHPELQLPSIPEDAWIFLRGVMAASRSRDDTLAITLPGVRPIVTWRDVDIDGPQRNALRLDTVHVDLVTDTLTLLYRWSIADRASLAWIEVEDSR